MDIKLLRHSIIKYMKFEEDIQNHYNLNFDYLLKYIGDNNDICRSKNDSIANAYIAIKKKTDELLGVNYKNDPLRTRKAEIKSVRMCFNNIFDKKHLTMKIPFKISYIFKAIICLVENIERRVSLPAELDCLKNETYRSNFYNAYYNKYINWYLSDDGIGCRTDPDYIKENELYNDFNAEGSPFLRAFQ